MSYSAERLDALFTSKGFVSNNYFTLNGMYRMVEIVNFHNAGSLMVYIGDKYQIPSQEKKHEYKLIKKDVVVDTSHGVPDEANLRSSYREIDHISRALQTEGQLHDIYDKPISLRGEEDKSQDKFNSTIRQLKRFRLCVRNIPYKFALFDDDCLCLLNDESEVESYFIDNYKYKKRKIFIITSLENFFKTDDIEQNVGKIIEQFYGILQTIQTIETQKIQSMIDAKRNIANQSKKILAMKQKLYDKIMASQKQHVALTERQQELLKKKKEIRGGDNKVQLEKIQLDIQKNDDLQRDIIKTILDTRKELDELYLVVDNLLCDNMIMLTKIQENFMLLERLKV